VRALAHALRLRALVRARVVCGGVGRRETTRGLSRNTNGSLNGERRGPALSARSCDPLRGSYLAISTVLRRNRLAHALRALRVRYVQDGLVRSYVKATMACYCMQACSSGSRANVWMHIRVCVCVCVYVYMKRESREIYQRDLRRRNARWSPRNGRQIRGIIGS